MDKDTRDGQSEVLRTQALDLLRFPLCVVIVLIHVLGVQRFVIQGQCVDVACYPFFVALHRAVEAFLRSQSVPIYFFISGYVFFLGVEWSRQKYAQKLRNRVHTLLIPYVIWNSVAVCLLLMKALPCMSTFLPAAQSIHFSWHGLLSCYWMYDYTLVPDPDVGVLTPASTLAPLDVPLWFVRDLMIVVVCTPLLYWLLRRGKGYAVAALGVLWFALGYTDYDYLYMLATVFFFFSLGAAMSILRRDMLAVFGRYFRLSLALYPLLAVLHIVASVLCPQAMSTIKQLNIVCGLFFAYNLAVWLLRTGRCTVHPFLAKSSFFIYVSHTLLCAKITRLIYSLYTPATTVGFIVLYIATFILTLTLLLTAFYLLRRYCPTVLTLLTGRR